MVWGKKANGAVVLIVLVIVIIILLVWAIKYGSRECSKDTQCPKDNYCGSDFKCHEIPIIEKIVVKRDINLTAPALILGSAIVVAAFVLKRRKEDELRSEIREEIKREILISQRQGGRVPIYPEEAHYTQQYADRFSGFDKK